ncbi:hypothetical protein [Pseudophaeobacter arcticus]|jgi:hypothetical protein|uniref:hypothetical protein n=1 Tax=Pseudophaeobacter arcticus TaxID=385492 RepID=UPI0039E47BE4
MSERAKRVVPSVKPGTADRLKAGFGTLTKALATTAAIAMALVTGTDTAFAAGQAPYVVGNDRGGFVRDRLIELRNLRSSGRPVEIRGRVCYSTCTMLLGLPNTCISPNTTFGFHGPSRSGRRLSPEKFDFYSRIIAANYPQELNSWYMQTGRKRINSIYKIKGRELIRMGIRAC